MLPCYIEGALPYTGWFQHGSCHTATVVAFSIANVYFFVTCPHRKTTGHLCEHTSSYQNLKTTLLYVDKYKYIYIYIYMNEYIWSLSRDAFQTESHWNSFPVSRHGPRQCLHLAPLGLNCAAKQCFMVFSFVALPGEMADSMIMYMFSFFFLKDTNQTQTCTVSG